MTEKNKAKQERKERRKASGQLWNGYTPKAEATKREREEKNRKKYRKPLDKIEEV